MNIRNFVIIAHIDHGKSTLADRFLELTGTVEKRKMREQFLDQMELERERGITIKMQPVRMVYHPQFTIYNLQLPDKKLETENSKIENSNSEYILNLIDTPGHVDFAYEVSRALAAVEGAILLVDGTQGIQAQTIAHLALAKASGLAILPVINKIDMPACRIGETREAMKKLLSCQDEDIFCISAKTGEGVSKLLDGIIEKIPPPGSEMSKSRDVEMPRCRDSEAAMGRDINMVDAPLRALVFDSQFDPYQGAIAHIRIFEGKMFVREPLVFLRSNARFNALETGFFAPRQTAKDMLGEGEIGYVATGLKEPREVRIGDTVTSKISNRLSVTSTVEPLPGYDEPKPMVFASAYPEHADDYELLRDSLRKLNLNDAAIQFEPESSSAIGRGFRVGFLGMLHLEIVGERLRREYGIAVIFTAPSVSYTVKLKNGKEQKIYSAERFPSPQDISAIHEPWVKMILLIPLRRLGAVTNLLQEIRGGFTKQEFFGHEQVEISYDAPLADIIVDFYDRLKSVTEGYGSMSYEAREERPGDLVKLEIRIAGEAQETLSVIIPKEKAAREGRRIAERLKTLLPRQLFPVAIQAAVGGDIIARETIPAFRKDVTGYLYGGDRTRKMKLWKKQQRGKKRLKETGKVEIPSDVFIKMLKR